MSRIEDVLALPTGERMKDSLQLCKPKFAKPFIETEAEYDVYKHAVFDRTKRKRKQVKVKTDKFDADGNPIYKIKYVEVCRVAVPIQKLLVERTAGFLLGKPAEYQLQGDVQDQQQKLYDSVMLVFAKNKMKYFDKKLARAVFREREAAELWYFVPDENGKPTSGEMRVQLLSPSRGDLLLPHFDDYGRMDGFGRGYRTMDLIGQYITHFDIYTNSLVYRFAKDAGGVVLNAVDAAPVPHGFDRMPIVYYRQEKTEWDDVQPSCDRVDTLLSNWGDTNDYFGSPSYFFKGKLKGFAEKGEQGKVYQGEGQETDMKVLSWDSSPESIKGELAQLFNIIFSYTQTPDISFTSMKEIGSNTSGVAINLMFTDPFMKADDKQELFGENFERRFNVVKGGCGQRDGVPESVVESTLVEPKFTLYLPKNEKEEIEIINLSTNGKATMSQEEAVHKNPKVDNPEETLKQLKQEAAEAAKQQRELFGAGDSFGADDE